MTERRTGRLAFLQPQELDSSDRRLVEDVATYGWHIIQVREDEKSPGWSYSVGLFDSYGHPEIIVAGLKPDLAAVVINECGRRIRSGAVIANEQRQLDLLNRVECEFRTVDPSWVQELMGFARWFYDTWEFPVLQCVYPDLENRFPWEEAYDSRFRERQPLLFSGAPWTMTEQKFLQAHQKADDATYWNFPVSRFTGVYTTSLINEGQEPVLYVSHDESDGAWQFHGASDSNQYGPVMVCFHHLTDRDASLHELADLPTGWCAWRDTPEEPWKREPLPPEPASPEGSQETAGS